MNHLDCLYNGYLIFPCSFLFSVQFSTGSPSMKVGELPFALHRRSCPWSSPTTSTDQNSNTQQQSPAHQRPSPLTALLFEANESSSSSPSTGTSPPDTAATTTATTTTPPMFTSQRCTCPCSDCVKLDRDSQCGMDMDLARWLTKCAEFGNGHTGLANINAHDRQILVCSAWKDIVILYMAQNKFNFDVVFAGMHEYLEDIPLHQYVQTYPTHHQVDSQFQGDFIAKTGVVSQTYVHPLRRGSDYGIPTMRTVNQLQFTLSKLNQMQLDSKEYAVLRILLLLNSGMFHEWLIYFLDNQLDKQRRECQIPGFFFFVKDLRKV